MAFAPRTRFVNPRLGIYFGIFTALFAALFFLVLILEQLAVPSDFLRWAMLAAPLALYAAIGLGVANREAKEWFASGRRVPAVYNGLALALTAIGGVGLLALTGMFFIAGFDALWLGVGGLAGFAASAALIAPFMRKSGAFTVPTYLSRRFDSRAVRVTAAFLLAVPMLFFLTAELRIAGDIAAALGGVPPLVMAPAVALIVVATVAPGGMRALSWSGAAQHIAAVLALMAPVATLAVLVTNLPLPQLTTGPLLRSLVRREAIDGFGAPAPSGLHVDLPPESFVAVAKPFAAAFSSMGSFSFTLATFSIMAGIAAAPWLLPRIATAPGVYEARKSLGWATFFFGVVMLTVASIGVFMRDILADQVRSGGGAAVWLERLKEFGYAAPVKAAAIADLRDVAFARDKILFALPPAAQMPDAMHYLALAGGLALAMAGVASVALALGSIVSEDIVNGLSKEPPGDAERVRSTQFAFAGVVAAGVALSAVLPVDPFKMLLWALALTGATAFPVLVLSIWWKRMNAFGALAGLASGFTLALAVIAAHEAGLLWMHGVLAGAVAMPASAAASIIVSLWTPAPNASMIEFLNEIRVAGGEILEDREARLARLREAGRGGEYA